MESLSSQVESNYKIWKKNSPLIYDTLISTTLSWPTLTLQFFPEQTIPSSHPSSIHRLLIGTHTNGSEPNHLLIAHLTIPSLTSPSIPQNRNESGGFLGPKANFAIKQKIIHKGEVNRARYMPHNPNIIAAKGPSGLVSVFDITCHPSIPASENISNKKIKQLNINTNEILESQEELNTINDEEGFIPDLVLNGCTEEGYALNWSMMNKGILCSSGSDRVVCEWDVEKQSREFESPRKYIFHEASVEDVDYSKLDQNTMISVGGDKRIVQWDRREDMPVCVIEEAHNGDVNCLDFSFKDLHKFVTGGSDGIVKEWDLRNLENPLNSIQAHNDEVMAVKFSPHEENLIGTASVDRTSKIFDLELRGMEQSEEDAQDGAVEMVFLHGGHKDRLTDLAWNWNDKGMVATSGEDNILQIWKRVRE